MGNCCRRAADYTNEEAGDAPPRSASFDAGASIAEYGMAYSHQATPEQDRPGALKFVGKYCLASADSSSVPDNAEEESTVPSQ